MVLWVFITTTTTIKTYNISPNSHASLWVIATPTPASTNPWSVFCPWSFADSRKLYRWIYRVCSLWILAPFTQHTAFEIHPCCCVLPVCSFLLLCSIPLYEYAKFWLPIHQLEDTWVVSIFYQLQMKLPWTFVYKTQRYSNLNFVNPVISQYSVTCYVGLPIHQIICIYTYTYIHTWAHCI